MISVLRIVLFIFFLNFSIGFVDFFVEMSNGNGCEMTYMYQLPEYVPIPLETRSPGRYANYHLYAYGEGQYAESLQLNHFQGNPVLFVPGNAGSHKQVRSLASVALVMSYTDRTQHHFNYFTLDYNEELSAFIGCKLLLQRRYLFHAIKKILSLYKKVPDVRIVLVGHSIGGILIKSLLTKDYFQDYLKHIALVITLATPHKYSAIPYDSEIAQFYHETNQLFLEERRTKLADINLLSIGGSTSDKIVRSDLIDLNSSYRYDLSILTTAINDVWTSADHLSIVWCRQLTVKLNQMLFDLVDPKSRVFISDPKQRQEIIDYHVHKRHFERIFLPSYGKDKISFVENNQWIEHKEKLVRLNVTKVLKPVNHMIELQTKVCIVIHVEGMFRQDTISACRASLHNGTLMCTDDVVNLYGNMTLVPPSHYKQDCHMARFDSNVLMSEGYTHLVIRLSSPASSYYVQVDRFSGQLRSLTVQLPSFWKSLWNGLAQERVFTKFVSQDDTYYELTLNGVGHVWNAYSMVMETKSCYKDSSTFVGYAKLSLSSKTLDEYIRPFRPVKGSVHHFHLLPNQFEQSKPASLHLHLEPKCGFELRVKYSLVYFSAQLMKHNFVLLVPTIVSILFLVLAFQLKRAKTDYSCSSQELKEFKDKLEHQNGTQGLETRSKCFIYPKAHEIMAHWKCFAAIYILIVCFQLSTLWSIGRFNTLYELSISPLSIQILVCSLLFMFSYSIVFVFSTLLYTLLCNTSLVIAFLNFKSPLRPNLTVIDNDQISRLWHIGWHVLLLAILTVVFLFCIPLTFYLQLLLFTLLTLARFVGAQREEMRIGRTSSTSYLMSIYPTIYLFLLIIVSYHIPDTIDRFNWIGSAWDKSPSSLLVITIGKNLSTDLSIIQSIESLGVMIFFYSLYRLSPSLPTRLAANSTKRYHQICLDLLSASLAFGNILLGVQTFDHITHFVLANLLVIVLSHASVFYLTITTASAHASKTNKLD